MRFNRLPDIIYTVSGRVSVVPLCGTRFARRCTKQTIFIVTYAYARRYVVKKENRQGRKKNANDEIVIFEISLRDVEISDPRPRIRRSNGFDVYTHNPYAETEEDSVVFYFVAY